MLAVQLSANAAAGPFSVRRDPLSCVPGDTSANCPLSDWPDMDHPPSGFPGAVQPRYRPRLMPAQARTMTGHLVTGSWPVATAIAARTTSCGVEPSKSAFHASRRRPLGLQPMTSTRCPWSGQVTTRTSWASRSLMMWWPVQPSSGRSATRLKPSVAEGEAEGAGVGGDARGARGVQGGAVGPGDLELGRGEQVRVHDPGTRGSVAGHDQHQRREPSRCLVLDVSMVSGAGRAPGHIPGTR